MPRARARGGISWRILSGRHLRGRGRRVVRCGGSGRFISSLPHSAAGCKLCVRACVPCASVQKIGREGAAAVAARLVRVVGLVDVLRCDYHQSPSRRPRQWEQLQRPFRVHLCVGVRSKRPMVGGNGARAASGSWERAHRHRCLKVCPRRNLGRGVFASETCLRFSPSRQTASCSLAGN